jgi:cell fate (sporulation/competence/biofilm development) regulator YmcA (YheA/YmcA/DUF963 family)
MEAINIIYKLKKEIKDHLTALTLVITSGGLDSIDKYKYIVGQINALESVQQAISSLLEQKEQDEPKGNVVDLSPYEKRKT